jgi:hypothetical protein
MGHIGVSIETNLSRHESQKTFLRPSLPVPMPRKEPHTSQRGGKRKSRNLSTIDIGFSNH